MTIDELEKEILIIKERNLRVEKDKAWETSLARKLVISALTYAVIVLLFLSVGITRPFLTAFVPALGFLLSTLSLPWIKARWIKYQTGKK